MTPTHWQIAYGCGKGGRREWFDVFLPGDHKARVYIKGNKKDAQTTAKQVAALPHLLALVKKLAATDEDALALLNTLR